MENTGSRYKGYALAAGLGAVGGGLIVALTVVLAGVVAVRAFSRLLPRLAFRMMRNVMTQMGAGDFEPARI